MEYDDERMLDFYLDENDCYNGADMSSMASKSYRMIHNAIAAVEALQLGGVVC